MRLIAVVGLEARNRAQPPCHPSLAATNVGVRDSRSAICLQDYKPTGTWRFMGSYLVGL